MSKGQSTFRQLGKIDGRKYYQMKGVDGIVSQSINQGMSNRVKNDAAFANTRLNNAEFGAAGSTAGAFIRSLSLKWRYILLPFATGKMAKAVRSVAMLDSMNPWGARCAHIGTRGLEISTALSEYSKNDFNDNIGIAAAVTDGGDGTISATATVTKLQNAIAASAGCTGVRIVVCPFGVLESFRESVDEEFYPAVILGEEQVAGDVAFGGDSTITASASAAIPTGMSDYVFRGAHIVAMPYREVNGEKYIMQELCSFKTIAL